MATAGVARRRRPYTARMPAAQRRAQLLDAALEIIARDGYAAVSIEGIARAVGVTRPVVYNVFEGLDDLLQALLDRQERRALAQLAAALPVTVDHRDVPGLVRRTIADLVAMLRADPPTWRLIFVPAAGTPAAVRARIDRDRELVRVRLAGVVELTGVATGADLDADIVAHALVGLGEYFGRLLLETPDAVDPDRLATTITAMITARRG
jgi:AcrR family transcriptional regulator